jgi:hypothetical protein
MVRYPDDPYDRVWFPRTNNESTVISTEKMVQNSGEDKFEAPLKVMQTAIMPRNASNNIRLDPSSPDCIYVLHFSELEPLPDKAVRQFNININGELVQDYTPQYLHSGAIFNMNPKRGNDQYGVTINTTANSTLPPIINAYEIHAVISMAKFGTESQDGMHIDIYKYSLLS